MAKESMYTLKSESDGLELQGYIIEPEGEYKGIIQMVHGMCEYKERYRDLMTYFADNGYVCAMHDHRGHGHSVKSEDDLGYFYEGGGTAVIEDVHQETVWLKEKYGTDVPFILLGHSMGSFVVRCYLQKYDAEIDKLLVLGSPSQNAAAGIGLALAKFLSAVKGGHAHSKLLDGMVSSAYEKRYAEENTPHAWVCSDKELVARYNTDKYCNYTFTINGYVALVYLTKQTYVKNGWGMKNSNLPIKFFSGEGDPCAVNRKQFLQAVQFLRDRGYSNVSEKMYAGMRHEIHNEPGKAQPYADMLEFINS